MGNPTPKPGELVLVNILSGQSYALKDGFRVGRMEGDLVLGHDGAVSSRHCAFRWNGKAYELEDLGSRNGTTVNGKKLEAKKPLAVAVGDKIEVGGATFAVQEVVESAYAAEPLAVATISGQLKPDSIPARAPGNWSGAAVPRRNVPQHTRTLASPRPLRPAAKGGGAGWVGWLALFALLGAGGYYYATHGQLPFLRGPASSGAAPPAPAAPAEEAIEAPPAAPSPSP
jgi:hypothetical protein